jgi:hypothetical protein
MYVILALPIFYIPFLKFKIIPFKEVKKRNKYDMWSENISPSTHNEQIRIHQKCKCKRMSHNGVYRIIKFSNIHSHEYKIPNLLIRIFIFTGGKK